MDYSGPGGATLRAPAHPLALPAIGVAAALWAVAGVVASRLFDLGVAPLHLVGARAVLTALGLALLPPSWQGPRGPARGVQLVLLGVALALVTATYYLAIDRLPVAIGIVLQYTGPVLVVAWTTIVLRRPLSPLVGAALVAATVGVVLVTGLASGDLGGLDPVGVLMGFGAAVTFAGYTVLSERVRQSYQPLAALFRGFSIAALLWLGALAPAGLPRDLWAPGVVAPAAFVCLGGTLAPFLLYVWAVAHVRAERASIAATLEPVLAAIIAWAWLGQALSASQVVGGLMVIGAVAALQAFAPAPSGN
jgi:DME family drug/metabolite transporter